MVHGVYPMETRHFHGPSRYATVGLEHLCDWTPVCTAIMQLWMLDDDTVASKPFRFCKPQLGCAKRKTLCFYMKLDNRHTDPHQIWSTPRHPSDFVWSCSLGSSWIVEFPHQRRRISAGAWFAFTMWSYCLMIDSYSDPIPWFPIQQHMRERCIKHVGCDSTSKGLLRKTLVALSSEKDGHCPYLKHQQRKLKRRRPFHAAQPISSNVGKTCLAGANAL